MGRRNKVKATEEVVEGQLPEKYKLEQKSEQENEHDLKSSVKTNAPGSNQITICMPCPESKMSLIIGKKGSVIGEIRKLSSCKITIDDQLKKNQPRPVHIIGSIADLPIAIKLIKEVIDAPKGAVLSWISQKPAENVDTAATQQPKSEKKEKPRKKQKISQAEQPRAEEEDSDDDV